MPSRTMKGKCYRHQLDNDGYKKFFGLSGAIALALFSERASVPGSIGTVFGVKHVVWFGFYLNKLLPKSRWY